MTKVALLADLHFGKHNDSPYLLNYQQKFFDELFFPTLKKHNITKVIQLGDLFDKRKQINFYTLKRSIDMFFNPCYEQNIKLVTLVGNHDTYFKSTNSLSATNQLLWGFDNIHIIDHPHDIFLSTPNKSIRVCALPWINPENEQTCFDHVKDTPAEYCIGHLDVFGALCSLDGFRSAHGYPAEIFKKFKSVWTGHFHNQSFVEPNIHYLGIPYQLTFMDIYDQKGFHLFDLEEETLEYVPNPHELYIRREITSEEDIKELDENIEQFKSKYVRLIVHPNINNNQLNSIYEKISKQKPINVHIQEIIPEIDTSSLQEMSIDIPDEKKASSSALDLLYQYMNQSLKDHDSLPQLKDIVHELYQDALLETDE